MKKILSLFLVLFSIQIQAQEYADKEFYLLDSLVLEDWDESEIVRLDSVLYLYHESEQDTDRLYHLQGVTLTLMSFTNVNLNIWKKFNDLMKSKVDEYREHTVNEKELHVFHFYDGIYYGNQAVFLYTDQNDMDNALNYFYLALESFVICEEEDLIGSMLSEIGVLFYNSGDYQVALEKFEASTKVLEEMINVGTPDSCYTHDGLSVNYKNIGNIYIDFKEYDLAEEYLLKALHTAEICQMHRRAGFAYQSLSKLAIELKNYEEALMYCDSAIKLFEKINLKRGLSIMSTDKGTILYELNPNNEVESYFNEAINIARQIDNDRSLNLALLFYGKYLLAENRIDKAEEILFEAYELLKNNAAKAEDDLTIYPLLEELYIKKGDYNKAHEMQGTYYSIKDSLFNNNLRNTLLKHDINNNYLQQKKIDDLENSQQLKLAEAQKQKTRIGMFAAVLIALIIAIAAYLIYSRLKVIQEQKVKLDDAYEQLEESKKNELAVSNLKALQSQMNPHFIFNALNSVQDLVLLKDIRSSNKFLGKFSDLIRKILLSSKQQFISLEEEVEILGLYLDLEDLRFGDEFHIDFTCEVSQEKQEEIQLPAMFIQPYIENAIKHGLFNKKGEKHLIVAFKMINETTLECIVQDNGVGQKQAALMKEQRLHLHTGFSTEAINERIRLLNQTLDKKIALEIIDLEEGGEALGTKIILHFPI